MRVLIESDGIGTGTKVTHVQSGVDLSNCISGIDITLNAGDLARAELRVPLVGLKVKAHVTPRGEQTDIANALYMLAERISREEIAVNIYQTDTDIRDVTGLGQRWREFVQSGTCLFIMWEPIQKKEEKKDDTRSGYAR